ncbi:hypothetical protein GCM10022230_15720 [Pseudoclavibacter caeni]
MRAILQAAEVVSFDVFDTLLQRPLARPADAFAVLRDAVREQGVVLPLTWPQERRAAESRAYQRAGVGPYITIDDIYDELVRRGSLSEGDRQCVLEQELEIEAGLLRSTRRGRTLFDLARASGADIVLLSDMYLPEVTIAQALRSAGYGEWSSLEVSGYAKRAKYDGTAFRHLREQYPERHLVHVGDSAHADVRQAHVFDIDTVHLRQPRTVIMSGGENATEGIAVHDLASERPLDELALADSTVAGLALNRLERHPDMDAAERLGYEVLGPLLAGFSRFLHLRAREDGIERLEFLARDGAILRRAYAQYWGSEALENDYLVASRRLLRLATFREHLVRDDLDFLTSTSTPLTPVEMIRRWLPDLGDQEVTTAIRLTTIEPDQRISEAEARAHLAPALEFLADRFIEQSILERRLVVRYLEPRFSQRATAVVDLGWQGTMAQAIGTLLGEPVKSYYVGVPDQPVTRARPSLRGWVDGRFAWEATEAMRRIFETVAVLESLTASPTEASAIGLTEVGENVQPVFGDERVTADEVEALTRIQDSAIEFVRDHAELSRRLPSRSVRLPFQAALRPLFNMMERPTPAQARVLGLFEHDNSLGVNRTVNLGAPKFNADHYAAHPEELEAEYENCWWKQGFEVNAVSRGIPWPPRP